MTTHEDYIGRCRGLVISLHNILTVEERSEVEHLIEHDEAPEAMRALAWIIVEGKKRVPGQVIVAIKELSKDLVAEEHMPPNLGRFTTD